jgi:hypothetical protein
MSWLAQRYQPENVLISLIHSLEKGRKGRHLLVWKAFIYEKGNWFLVEQFENKICTVSANFEPFIWQYVVCRFSKITVIQNPKYQELKLFLIVWTAAPWSTASNYGSYATISNLCSEAHLVLKTLTDSQSNNWTPRSLIEIIECNKNKDLNFIEWLIVF